MDSWRMFCCKCHVPLEPDKEAKHQRGLLNPFKCLILCGCLLTRCSCCILNFVSLWLKSDIRLYHSNQTKQKIWKNDMKVCHFLMNACWMPKISAIIKHLHLKHQDYLAEIHTSRCTRYIGRNHLLYLLTFQQYTVQIGCWVYDMNHS